MHRCRFDASTVKIFLNSALLRPRSPHSDPSVQQFSAMGIAGPQCRLPSIDLPFFLRLRSETNLKVGKWKVPHWPELRRLQLPVRPRSTALCHRTAQGRGGSSRAGHPDPGGLYRGSRPRVPGVEHAAVHRRGCRAVACHRGGNPVRAGIARGPMQGRGHESMVDLTEIIWPREKQVHTPAAALRCQRCKDERRKVQSDLVAVHFGRNRVRQPQPKP